jgi:hypothetical protein
MALRTTRCDRPIRAFHCWHAPLCASRTPDCCPQLLHKTMADPCLMLRFWIEMNLESACMHILPGHETVAGGIFSRWPLCCRRLLWQRCQDLVLDIQSARRFSTRCKGDGSRTSIWSAVCDIQQKQRHKPGAHTGSDFLQGWVPPHLED